MDTQEILSKIAKLKKAVESESDEDIKPLYYKRIANLEAQVAEAESKVEKNLERFATDEKKAFSDEEKIKLLQNAIASESDTDVKGLFQKKLHKLQGTLNDVKEEIKEEEKAELINKINNKSKKLKFEASRNYRSNATSSMPYEEVVVLSQKYPDLIFLVHKNMIFGRNSVCDSSYDVYSFDRNGENVRKEDVQELGRDFFTTMKVLKKL